MPSVGDIVQVSPSRTRGAGRPVPAVGSDNVPANETADGEALRAAIKSQFGPQDGSILSKFCDSVSHMPLLVPAEHEKHLRLIQTALNKAIVNIVGRWWTDERAAFPKRMPLAEEEEELLRWVETCGHVKPYAQNQGIWRPDYLIEESQDSQGRTTEHIVLCEINARLPLNSVFLSADCHDALAKAQGPNSCLVMTCELEQVRHAALA
ncbi:hypothetical protein MRB53_038804 [Persea americana]|nr:hypothetical protein MRB53_038804 [Persea americana]